MILAEDGSKMMSKQNYPNPESVFATYGSDALSGPTSLTPQWFALEPLRFTETGVKEVVRTVLIPSKRMVVLRAVRQYRWLAAR